jgi:hypothetical protein
LGIVLRIHTRHADAASVDHDRDAAFDQRRPRTVKYFNPTPPPAIASSSPSAIPIAARCEPSRLEIEKNAA